MCILDPIHACQNVIVKIEVFQMLQVREIRAGMNLVLAQNNSLFRLIGNIVRVNHLPVHVHRGLPKRRLFFR